MWPCPGNMPKYYPALKTYYPTEQEGNMSLRPG